MKDKVKHVLTNRPDIEVLVVDKGAFAAPVGMLWVNIHGHRCLTYAENVTAVDAPVVQLDPKTEAAIRRGYEAGTAVAEAISEAGAVMAGYLTAINQRAAAVRKARGVS